MRFAIINADYPAFLASLYEDNPGLERASYDEQLRVRNASLFGVADFYSRNLRMHGHEAVDLHANNWPLQNAWAREFGLKESWCPSTRHRVHESTRRFRLARTPLRRLRRAAAGFLAQPAQQQGRMTAILREQIAAMRPDVVLNQAVDWIPSSLIESIRPAATLIVGQIAAPIPNHIDVACYDLLLSSLPNFVNAFRAAGHRSEWQALAFEPAVLDLLPRQDRDVPVSFVGSVGPTHASRMRLLEYVATRVELSLWGTLAAGVSRRSPLRACYQGPAWGIDMYDVLQRSHVTLNHHIDIAGPYANNMRLFEATGVGTALVTDSKANLNDLFEAGRDVTTYRSDEECVAQIRQLLADPVARRSAADAGQARTLRDHTYAQRTTELVDIVSRYL